MVDVAFSVGANKKPVTHATVIRAYDPRCGAPVGDYADDFEAEVHSFVPLIKPAIWETDPTENVLPAVRAAIKEGLAISPAQLAESVWFIFCGTDVQPSRYAVYDAIMQLEGTAFALNDDGEISPC